MPEAILPCFYLNENIHVQLVALLKSIGIESIHTYQANNKEASDEFQLQYAAERGLILVTHNKRHFTRLHTRWVKNGKKHRGILIMKQDEPENLLKRIRLFLDQEYHKLTPPFCVPPPRIIP